GGPDRRQDRVQAAGHEGVRLDVGGYPRSGDRHGVPHGGGGGIPGVDLADWGDNSRVRPACDGPRPQSTGRGGRRRGQEAGANPQSQGEGGPQRYGPVRKWEEIHKRPHAPGRRLNVNSCWPARGGRMISMSLDEFWLSIEQCRQHSDSMAAFNGVLEAMLDTWELPKLAAFHKVMWRHLGVYNDD